MSTFAWEEAEAGDGRGDNHSSTKKLKCAKDDEEESALVQGEVVEGGEDTASLAPVFCGQYHVVKHILEYLKIRDLLQAGIVNQQWSNISRIVRKQRKNRPYSLISHHYQPHHQLAFEYFNNYQVSQEATDLVESGNDGYHPYKRRSYPKQKFPRLLEDTRTRIKDAVINGYDEPQLIVSFGTSSFDQHLLAEHDAKHRKVSKERQKIFLGGIQNSVPCLTSFSCGVIASVPELGNKSLEMEKEKFPVLSSLAVPKVSGLRVKLFTVTKEQMKELKGKESVDNCKALLGIETSEEAHLKGIMLLHKATHRASPLVNTILKYLRSKPHIALAGGVHDAVLATGTPDATLVAAGLLIFGTDLVRVSSVALEESGISENNTKKLDKLKASLLPSETSFGFMFTCNGRGRGMHGRPNVESDLINSLFPNTPWLGAFTFGEYCNDTLIKISEGEEEKRVEGKYPENIDYAYTTALLLISYRHPPELQDT